MKKFGIYILMAFVLYIILLECTTRIFDLSGHTIPEVNLNDNKLTAPNAEGIWVKGGMQEISSHYKINQQGFNSTKDYSKLDNNKISIALIGDSYVEGFHVDVEASIGRILEKETNDKVEVHEYGKSGGNIADFSLMFNQWIKNKYDYTFILVTDKDLIPKKPSFMGRGKKIRQKSVGREIYNKVSFVRYLNINHGLISKLKKIFSLPKKKKAPQNDSVKNQLNESALKGFDSTCFILYERENLEVDLMLPFNLPCIEIKHQLKPFSHGFDSHWNGNGRKNCAMTMKMHLNL